MLDSQCTRGTPTVKLAMSASGFPNAKNARRVLETMNRLLRHSVASGVGVVSFVRYVLCSNDLGPISHSFWQSCEKPFENPSFFQRGDKPYCERCFDIMLRNEV